MGLVQTYGKCNLGKYFEILLENLQMMYGTIVSSRVIVSTQGLPSFIDSQTVLCRKNKRGVAGRRGTTERSSSSDKTPFQLAVQG